MKKSPFLFLYFILPLVLALSSCRVQDYASNSRPVTHEIWDSLLHEHVLDHDSEEWLIDYCAF